MESSGAQGFPDGEWLIDWFSPFEFTAHTRLETLHREQSPFQRIEIVRTPDYGRCLLLDDELQSCEADEFIYHEALVHPALILHPDPRRVLVIGGGEGATLREVLRHRSVELVRMVELDERVVAASQAHLDTFHAGAFDDPRVRLTFGDGRAFLETSHETWDMVILDLNNPLEGGPSARLFTAEFYRAVRARLTVGGVLAAQSGAVSTLALRCPCTVFKTVATALPDAHLAMAHVPSFASGWSFVVAGKGPVRPLSLSAEDVDRRIVARVSAPLRYYDGVTHQHLFSVPRYVREALRRTWTVSRDDRPIVERYPGYTPETGSGGS